MIRELRCKKCEPPTRQPGCHAYCEDYIEWQKERSAEKAKSRAEKIKRLSYEIYKTDIVRKTKRN